MKNDFDKLKAIENTMQPDECESCQIEADVIESGIVCDYCKYYDIACNVCGPMHDCFSGKRVKEV